MGSDCSTQYFDPPFPDNSGSTKVVRSILRTEPLYGPSEMPYVPKAINTVHDAIGRPIVEDGNNRLIAGSLLSRVFVHKVHINANIFIDIKLCLTKELNNMMQNLEMEALYVLDDHNVMIFSSNPSRKFIEKSVASIGIATTIASLDASPNRLTESQLKELAERMIDSFNKHGVGALVKNEKGFNYRILVPNVPEYEKYKEHYDEIEIKIKKDKNDKIDKERKIADNFRHARTKSTRSGKKYDDGYNDTRATHVLRMQMKRMLLKHEKRNAINTSNAKHTRSGKTYDDGYGDMNVFLNRAIKRMKRTRLNRDNKKRATTNAAIVTAVTYTTVGASGVAGVAGAAGASGVADAAGAAGATGAAGAAGATYQHSTKKARI